MFPYALCSTYAIETTKNGGELSSRNTFHYNKCCGVVRRNLNFCARTTCSIPQTELSSFLVVFLVVVFFPPYRFLKYLYRLIFGASFVASFPIPESRLTTFKLDYFSIPQNKTIPAQIRYTESVTSTEVSFDFLEGSPAPYPTSRSISENSRNERARSKRSNPRLSAAFACNPNGTRSGRFGPSREL